MVTVDEIVEEGEGPEDAKDGEEFTIQDLVVSDFIIQISIRLQTNPELASHLVFSPFFWGGGSIQIIFSILVGGSYLGEGVDRLCHF